MQPVSPLHVGTTDAHRPSPARLELRGLACERGERRLFGAIDAQLRAGELLRVRGPNGAGKTSLLRIVCGLLAPRAGDVLWDGAPIGTQRDAFHRALVYLSDGAALKDDLSAAENLRVACALGGAACSPRDAAEALDEVGLHDCHGLPARWLSRGQRRRATLARLALRHAGGAPAGLWVLDEPFNALDADAVGWLQGRIRRHLEHGGVAVLTSHQDVALGDGVAQTAVSL